MVVDVNSMMSSGRRDSLMTRGRCSGQGLGMCSWLLVACEPGRRPDYSLSGRDKDRGNRQSVVERTSSIWPRGEDGM